MSVLGFSQKEQNNSFYSPDSLMQLYNISEDSVVKIFYRNLDMSSNTALASYYEMFTMKNRKQHSEFNEKILLYIERKLNLVK